MKLVSHRHVSLVFKPFFLSRENFWGRGRQRNRTTEQYFFLFRRYLSNLLSALVLRVLFHLFLFFPPALSYPAILPSASDSFFDS